VARRDLAVTHVLRGALRDAGAAPSDVGHIHAHGLGSPATDADEALAIRTVFGELAQQPPVTSAKSYFGNLGAGGGVVELISSVLAVRSGELFPILNFETPDPDCPVAVAKPGAKAGRSFLNVNVTQQGQASCVMVRAFD
jgi:3-oxoacyl-[acyl-carrier-protein] synthase II